MPRKRRNFGTNGLNHCIVRGIDKRDIFFDDQDRRKFLKGLKEFKLKYKVKLGTYTLMQNHVHLIIQGKNENISRFFQGILVSYSSYFNNKYDRVGHLFENRFKNKVIDSEDYLKNLVKYIHFNPEKAGICQAKRYKWSGYSELFKDETWLDSDIILSHYGESLEEARKILMEQHSSKLDKYYEDFAEYEMVYKLTDEQVKALIDKKMEQYPKKDNKSWDGIYKNSIINEILNTKGVTINQVSRITSINRILLKKIKDSGEKNCPRL